MIFYPKNYDKPMHYERWIQNELRNLVVNSGTI